MIKISSEREKLLTVKIPASKSHLNRAFILASYFHGRKWEIINKNNCNDVLELIHVLKQLGVEIIEEDNSYTVYSNLKHNSLKNKKINLYLGSGGTTIRFILPYLAFLGGDYEIKVSEEFKNRPILEIIEPLKILGIKFSSESFPLKMNGQLNSSEITIDCSKSSQFLSSFKMLATQFSFILNFKNLKTSEDYLKLTDNMIECFKIEQPIIIPICASSFSYAISYGLTIGPIEILNQTILQEDIKNQGDWRILNFCHESLQTSYSPKKLNSFSINIEQNLDLFPTLVYLASVIDGQSEISGIKNLVYKESNRINESLKILNLYNINYEIFEDKIIIKGTSKKNKIIDYVAPADHRLVMASYLFLKFFGGGTIDNEQHVCKSFPDFFNYFK